MFVDECNESFADICCNIAVIRGVEPNDFSPAFLFCGRGVFLVRLRGGGKRIGEFELEIVPTVSEGLFIVRFGVVESITIT